MTKVAKTIKRLRVQNNLTQEALAQKLNVTRQTVSGWENNRTQPDLETLDRLAGVFEVEIEELIYGRSRKDLEKKADPQKILTVVFAIIGTLLLGGGLVIIFLNTWMNIPDVFLSVFSFLPMLAGQGIAFFVYSKKKDSIPWREGAAVLWCAGSAATVAAVDSVFALTTSFFDCFILDGILFLPVIFLLDAVSPLVAYYAAVLTFGIQKLDATASVFWFFCTVLLLSVGVYFTWRKRKNAEDIRYIYCVWLTTIAFFVLFGVMGFAIEDGYLGMLGLLFLALYLSDKGANASMPAGSVGLLGSAVMSVVASIFLHPDVKGSYASSFRFDELAFFAFLISSVSVAGGVLIGKNHLLKNRFKLIYCALGATVALLSFAGDTLPLDDWMFFIILPVSVAQAASLIVLGAQNGRFVYLNLGMLMIAALFVSVLLAFSLSIVEYGVVFVVMGATILIVNYKFSKTVKRKIAESESSGDE